MAAKSAIEWTGSTWNPSTGCDAISPGCENCYAERMSYRLKAMGQTKYQNGFKLTLHPDTLERDACTGNFFAALGIVPQYGRFFSAGEDTADASVAVVSDRYWRNRFGADPSVVGRAVTINRISFTVIGITPPDFLGISAGSYPDIWVPLHALDRLEPDSKRWTEPLSSWILIAGRLRAGISRVQAQAELDVVHRRFLAEQLATSELRNWENVQRYAREGHLVLRPAWSGVNSDLRDRYAFPLKLL